MPLAVTAGIPAQKALSPVYAAWVRCANAVANENPRWHLRSQQLSGPLPVTNNRNVSTLFAGLQEQPILADPVGLGV